MRFYKLFLSFFLFPMLAFLTSCNLNITPESDASSESSSNSTAKHDAKIYIVRTNSNAFNASTLAIDSKGYIFVNDSQNRILKFNATSEITVFATGVPCRFLVIDKNNNLFAIPPSSGSVSKISTSGIVTTVGSFTGEVSGATVDGSGNIFISISGPFLFGRLQHSKILKMTPGGSVSIFAGGSEPGYLDANGTSAQFNGPQGLAFDDTKGILYVVDSGNSVIRKIDQQGNVGTYAGSSNFSLQNGSFAIAGFQFRDYGAQPEGLAISKQGDMFVGERYAVGILRLISANGNVYHYCGDLKLGGGSIEGPCLQSPFYQSGTMAIGPDEFLYFLDGGGNVAKIDISKKATTNAEDSNKTPGKNPDPSELVVPFEVPTSLLVDNNFLYWGTSVSWQASNSSIKRVSSNSVAQLSSGVLNYNLPTTLVANTQFTFSTALDSGVIYWNSNSYANRISSNGGNTTQLATSYSTPIAVDSNGLYFSNSPNGLRKVDKSTGANTQLVASPNTSVGSSDAITVYGGFIYWSDYSGNLKKISTSGGAVTTLYSGPKASSIATDGTNIYWSDNQGIHSIPISGGTKFDLAPTSGSNFGCVQVNSGSVFWASETKIQSVSTNGGEIKTLADLDGGIPLQQRNYISSVFNGPSSSNCIAIYSDYVFFGKTQGGIYRVKK
jgi:hypothetical protein